MLMAPPSNATGEGVAFRVGEETTLKQWHHLAGDATSGQFSDEHRLVRVSTDEIGRHMMDSLDDEVRALQPEGDLFDYQIVATGKAFVPWLPNTAAFEWRASVRVNPARASGLDRVVVAWHPDAKGTASKAVLVDTRGPSADPVVQGIANAKKSLYGTKGWSGHASTATGRGLGLRGDGEPQGQGQGPAAQAPPQQAPAGPAAQAPGERWESWAQAVAEEAMAKYVAASAGPALADSRASGSGGADDARAGDRDWWKKGSWWGGSWWGSHDWSTSGGGGSASTSGPALAPPWPQGGSASAAPNPWEELG